MSRYINGTYSSGIQLSNPGDNPVTVGPSSYIGGSTASYGLFGSSGTAWTITNDATIVATATNGIGVHLTAGGTLTNGSTNAKTPVITGSAYGVLITGGPASVANYGLISGNVGVSFYQVVGQTTYVSSGTVVNAGTIAGSGGTAIRFGNGAERLVIDPGAVFVGNVIGGSGANTMELASAASAGTIGGIGSSFTGFGSILVDAGAAWTLTGANTVASGASLTDAGVLTVTGSLTNLGAIGGAGRLVDAGSLVNAGSIGTALTLSGGYFANQAGGTVSNTVYGTTGTNGVNNLGLISGNVGVSFYQVVGQTTYVSSGTVVNAGTIAGSGGTAIRFGNGAERLVIDPGAVFVGNVIGGSGANTMELASAASAGTIGGIGSSFTGFGSILVDAGAAWTLTGANTVASGASLTDAGVLTVTGSLTNLGTIGGAGRLVDAGSLVNAGSIGTALTLSGGYFANQAGGTVSNTVYGTTGTNGVNNLGLISGNVGVSFYQVVGQTTYVSSGTVVNAGTIAGSGGTAIRFGNGVERLVIDPGAVFVGNVIGGSGANTMELASAASAGTIGGIGSSFTGFGSILVDAGAAWTLTGANTVASGASLTDAGVLTVTGSLTNLGTIGGTGRLVDAGSLINAGSIGTALTLTGGTLTNQAGGTISNTVYGTTGTNSVSNLGLISGNVGVSFYQVVGQTTYVSTGTVVNAGTIAGSGGTAIRFGNGVERLVIDPGAVFVGNVIGGSGANTMELASAASAGTIGGIGSSFTGFGSILVDAGAAWTLTGANTVASGASLTDAGVLTVTGSLTNLGAIGGAGQLVDAGSLINAGSIGTALTLSGGYFANQAGGTVTGTVYGIAGSNRVTNLGRLNGILLATGGSVSNGSSLSTGAIVAGVQYGVAVHGGTGVIVNDGAISASATSGFAVTLGAGGMVTNGAAGLTSASIKGGSSGVFVTGAAGTLTNYGSISGVNNGAAFSKAGTVTNFGTVTGTTFYGLVLNAGGVVTNGGGTSHAAVDGGSDGILLRGGSGTVTNLGSIAGTGFAGVALSGGGGITNGTAASITGGTYGAFVAGTSVTVANYGTIAGTTADGIYAASGAIVTNGSTSGHSALIKGGYYGIVIAGQKGTISNSGSIGGTTDAGVYLQAGGTVTNNAAARISGVTDGLQIIGAASKVTNAGLIIGATGVLFGTGSSGSTIINSGTIAGTAGTAVSFIGGNDRLILKPGATFVGAVVAGSSTSTLELSGSPSSLAGLGTSFVNFTNIVVDSGAKWTLKGSNTLGTSTTLASAGTLIVAGTLHDQGGVSVTGTLQTGGTIAQLQLGGSVTLNGGTLLVNKHASLEVGSKGGAQIGTITVDAGSTIAGSGTLTGGSLLLNGTVDGKGSGLTIIDDISGTGSLVIDANSRVTAEAAVASSVVFAAGGGETLALGRAKVRDGHALRVRVP